MNRYPKINSVYTRNEKGELVVGQYSDPIIEYLADNEWEFTEKVDGTNVRVQWDGENPTFRGRSDAAQMPPFLLDKLAEFFSSERMLKCLGTDEACLYGEGFGARIQKGGGNYISDGVSFVLFDVRMGDLWLKRRDVEDVARMLDIGAVPIVGMGPLSEMIQAVEDGFDSHWGAFNAEGVVARPKLELQNRSGIRIITKLKTKDFLRTA